MTIHKDSKSSIEKFLNRCIVHQNYNISIYVKDMESAELLLEEILAYYKANGNEGIESTSKDYAIQIFFTTGSVLRIFTTENMVSYIHAHLVFMDSRIRETYVRENIHPFIDKFDLGNENFIINPKLIYIKFLNEEDRNENDTEKQ